MEDAINWHFVFLFRSEGREVCEEWKYVSNQVLNSTAGSPKQSADLLVSDQKWNVAWTGFVVPKNTRRKCLKGSVGPKIQI